MERNVCGLDRLVRLTVGTALALAVLGSRWGRTERGRGGTVAGWEILAAYAASELLINAVTQWCPVNALLGINTCGRDDASFAAA